MDNTIYTVLTNKYTIPMMIELINQKVSPYSWADKGEISEGDRKEIIARGLLTRYSYDSEDTNQWQGDIADVYKEEAVINHQYYFRSKRSINHLRQAIKSGTLPTWIRQEATIMMNSMLEDKEETWNIKFKEWFNTGGTGVAEVLEVTNFVDPTTTFDPRNTEMALTEISSKVSEWGFLNTDNPSDAPTKLAPSDMVLLLSSYAVSKMNVDVRGKFFGANAVLSPLPEVKTIPASAFTDPTTEVGYLVDKRFAHYYLNLLTSKSDENSTNLHTYDKLHHWGAFHLVPFANAKVIKVAPVTP